MKQVIRRQKKGARAARELEKIHHALIALYDELTETTAWTALVCDSICGVVDEQSSEVDSATHTGMRFAAIWLKQRNRNHASRLQAACEKLRAIRKLA